MAMWEYASLSVNNGMADRCTLEGDQRIMDRGPDRGGGIDERVSRLVAEMGRDGWELTTSMNGALWFKRPIAQVE